MATHNLANRVTVDAGTGWPPIATAGSAAPTTGNVVLGTDGTNARVLKTDSSGRLAVADDGQTISIDDGGGSITIDGSVSVTGTVTADTELPAAAALADGAANPTTPTVGAGNLVFNGTTWDRARGDVTNGLDVDVTRLPSGTLAASTAFATADFDTGGGTQTVLMTGIALPASGGSVVGGTSTNPIQVGDAGGTLSIDDGGGSITIDGSVSVTGTVTADTELPAAAALADAAGNPTTPTVGAANLMWNGTGWDRARGDITNGIDVDVTRVSGNVTVIDGGGSISIDDNGGSITIDGSVTIIQPSGSSATFSTVSVGTSATLLLASNGSRKAFECVVNQGAEIYWATANTVTAGTSASATGGTWVSIGGSFDGANMHNYTGNIYGITASGTAIVSVKEFT